MTKQQAMIKAICEACGMVESELPKSAFRMMGKVAAELLEINATPEDVLRRAEVYAQRFSFNHGQAILTPAALLKHWASLKTETKQAGETEFQLCTRLAKERGMDGFKGAPFETPEQFIQRVNSCNVVKFG